MRGRDVMENRGRQWPEPLENRPFAGPEDHVSLRQARGKTAMRGVARVGRRDPQRGREPVIEMRRNCA